jgi:predicted nucleic acid-binding protein
MLTLDTNIWIAAYDLRDRFHHESTIFLTALTRRRLTLYGPAFVTVEAGCALARRAQDMQAGAKAIKRLNAYPLLTLLPLNKLLLATASELGARHLIRGADALFVAAAALSGAPLVSWDRELVSRAGAITPADWLATNIP